MNKWNKITNSKKSLPKYNDTYYEMQNNLTDIEGINTYSVCAENSNGEECTETRTITGDSIPPEITIISPESVTYSTNNISLNISINEAGDWCGYSINDAANVTMNKVNNTYFKKRF
jgi:hypothetical protein